MTLLASVSGIRGTIGGRPRESLTPQDIVQYTAAYGMWLQQRGFARGKIVLGRDARLSGKIFLQITASTLQAMGFSVCDIDLSTTPTTQMCVLHLQAAGGIVITASHNPIEWNALKLLNQKGEYISPKDAEEIQEIVKQEAFSFASYDQTGDYTQDTCAMTRHIDAILRLPLVDTEAIREKKFRVALDAVNSTGGLALIPLLEKLGVKEIVPLYCQPTGVFPHTPEPLPEHLQDIMTCVQEKRLDLGFVVDPDVDRLAIITEKGHPFGEEYTLVAVADYVWAYERGSAVSNLSSSRALSDLATQQHQPYESSAVGEIHVVEKMKACGAVIGGEGNGGVIYPKLHYGRDALVGAALFLSHLAHKSCSVSELRTSYPSYEMVKSKVSLQAEVNISSLMSHLSMQYKAYPQQRIDGLRIDFRQSWLHIRPSNTEPVLRLYSEAPSQEEAQRLILECQKVLTSFI